MTCFDVRSKFSLDLNFPIKYNAAVKIDFMKMMRVSPTVIQTWCWFRFREVCYHQSFDLKLSSRNRNYIKISNIKSVAKNIKFM